MPFICSSIPFLSPPSLAHTSLSSVSYVLECSLLLLNDRPNAVPHGDLCKLLDKEVDVATNGGGEMALHAMHQEGEAFDGSYHLHKGQISLRRSSCNE